MSSLKLEIELRDHYLQALGQKDSLWWKHEVSAINNKIVTEKDRKKGLVYRRLKGYLGVACYSFCNRAKAERDWLTLERIILVYRLLEPVNPDMFYFSAVLANSKKDSVRAQFYLQKAKENGFEGLLKIQ